MAIVSHELDLGSLFVCFVSCPLHLPLLPEVPATRIHKNMDARSLDNVGDGR